MSCEHVERAGVLITVAVQEGDWPRPSDLIVGLTYTRAPVPHDHPPRRSELVSRGTLVRAITFLAIFMFVQLLMGPSATLLEQLAVSLTWFVLFLAVMLWMLGWMRRLGWEDCHCDCE